MIIQKKKAMIDPPKITPPSVDMYKAGSTPNNIGPEEKSKKQPVIF
jgi:hypothetical protein